MKKLLTCLPILLFTTATYAHDTTIFRVNASDPTQIYTNLDVSAGITFKGAPNNFGPDSWQFGLVGNFAIKKFLVGFKLPITNVGNNQSSLDDIDFYLGYQLFNSRNTFKSSLVKAGVLFPTSHTDDQVYLFPEPSGFFKYYFNYTASLKFNRKFGLYPTAQVSYYKSVIQSTYIPNSGSVQYPTDYTQLAYGGGLVMSYDFNRKNFVQAGGTFESGTFKAEQDSVVLGTDNELSRHVFSVFARYQHSFTKQSHLYVQFNYQAPNEYEAPYNSWETAGYNLSIGYQYYLR